MSVHALSRSSSIQYVERIPYKKNHFDQIINKRSWTYTAKKAVIVTGITLGSTALIAGIALAAISSAGIAILPLGAATAVPISLLSAGGAGGVVGGLCKLRSIKVNRAAGKVLKAANLITEEAGNLQRVYIEQGSISVDLVKKLQALKNATNQLGEKLAEGDKKLQETAKETKQTQKEQEKIEKNIQQVKTLTMHLDDVLEKLNHTTISTKETQKLIKTMEKLIKAIEKLYQRLDKEFPRIEQSLKEYNQALQCLNEDLSFLQRAKPSLIDLRPSKGLEDAVKFIQCIPK